MEMDLTSSLDPQVALDSQDITSDTTTVGNIIDSQGHESMDFTIQSGTVTDGTYTALLEDGDAANLSDAATVSSDLIIGTLPVFVAADDDAVKHFGSVSKKRYQRLSIVSASTTTGATKMSSVANRGNAKARPTV